MSDEISESKKRKGANWTSEETVVFLQQCAEKNIMQLMDGKRHKHTDIYKLVQAAMEDAGFKKTTSQLKIKLKHLKENYYKCKRNNNTSGMDRGSFEYYDLMDALLSTRPKTLANSPTKNESGVDTSEETSFVEVDVRMLSEEEAESISRDSSDMNIKVIDFSHDFIPSSSNSHHAPSYNTNTSSSSSSSSSTRTYSKGAGRSSYTRQMNDFAQTLCQKQLDQLKAFSSQQQEQFQKNMARELEKQREWETKMAAQEREFQAKLMSTMLQSLQQLAVPHSNGQFHSQNSPLYPHLFSYPNYLPSVNLSAQPQYTAQDQDSDEDST